jgi:hypothetical protein
LPRWAGGGRFATAIPPSRPNLIPAFAETPNTQDELFDPIIRRSGGGRGSLVAAFIAIALTLSHLMFQSPRTREEQHALNKKIEAAQFAYRRLTHQMAAQFSREELERIKAESGVNFDIIERELPAPPANSDLEEGRQSEADDGGAAIRPWIPFISRDIPEDDDYCLRRWEAEQRRCLRWPQKNGTRRKCLRRASYRHDLCFRNGGKPDPNEPDEWSESDMEDWYNPDR